MSTMYKMALIFALLLGGIFTAAVDADTNPCFESAKQSSDACRHYNYDKLNAYFRDDAGVEQKVIVKRVLSKTNGQLLHANYDFEVQCHNQLTCASTEHLTTEVLWAFRNAMRNNRLYTVSYKACDPREEICCNDDGVCSEILNVGEQGDQAAMPAKSVEILKKNKKVRTEEVLRNAEAATNIMDNVVRTASNGFDFKQQVITEVIADMPAFAYTETSSGSFTLCKLEHSGQCDKLQGRMTDYSGSGYAEFTHDKGQNANKELSDFLWRFFAEDRGMTCNLTMKCEANDRCSIHMTCMKR